MIESLHRRTRKGHAQAQGGALIRECKETKIEGGDQPSSGRAPISCVLKLRQTQTRWCCAIAVGIAANHLPEPAQTFFLSPGRECQLRELLSGTDEKKMRDRLNKAEARPSLRAGSTPSGTH